MALIAISALAQAGAAAAAGPSRKLAQRYAHRTYVIDPVLGQRRFELIGARESVRASDGSTITAFAMLLADSGDGTGQAVLLFRGGHFLGWASTYITLRLGLSSSGSAIRVRYGVYRGDDPFCCPSSTKTVSYRWVRGRIRADKDAPLIFGRRGSRLQLSG